MPKYMATQGLYRLIEPQWTSLTIQVGLLVNTSALTSTQIADFATVQALLTGGGTEASVGGYSRQTLASKTVTKDLTNDWVSLDAADAVFANLATGQNITGVFYFISGASDAARDLLAVDVLPTPIATNGQSITVAISDFLRTATSVSTSAPTPGVETPPPPPADDGSWPRPSSRSQLGPRPTVTLVPDARTVIPAGNYTGLNFYNGVTFSGTGAFNFIDCVVPIVPYISGITSGRTVLMQHCQTFGFFSDGGQANWTLEWCLAKGNHVAMRPEGSPQYNVTTMTPFTARSCLFVSEGKPDADSVHCEAMQALGGRGFNFTGCWFEIEPRLNSTGNTFNTAAYNGMQADSTFTRCGFGPYGAAFYMVYSDGPNSNFNDCVVGKMGDPANERPLRAADFYSDANGPLGANRAYINGVHV